MGFQLAFESENVIAQ